MIMIPTAITFIVVVVIVIVIVIRDFIVSILAPLTSDFQTLRRPLSKLDTTGTFALDMRAEKSHLSIISYKDAVQSIEDVISVTSNMMTCPYYIYDMV